MRLLGSAGQCSWNGLPALLVPKKDNPARFLTPGRVATNPVVPNQILERACWLGGEKVIVTTTAGGREAHQDSQFPEQFGAKEDLPLRATRGFGSAFGHGIFRERMRRRTGTERRQVQGERMAGNRRVQHPTEAVKPADTGMGIKLRRARWLE